MYAAHPFSKSLFLFINAYFILFVLACSTWGPSNCTYSWKKVYITQLYLHDSISYPWIKNMWVSLSTYYYIINTKCYVTVHPCHISCSISRAQRWNAKVVYIIVFFLNIFLLMGRNFNTSLVTFCTSSLVLLILYFDLFNLISIQKKIAKGGKSSIDITFVNARRF